MIRSFTIFLSLSAAAFAQVGGPILGYLPDGASIRTLYGLPAAGAIGPAVHTGFAQAAVSPQQNFVIAADASTGSVVLQKFGAAATPIAGAAANPDRIAISPSGASAALWMPSSQHFQIVTGLPDSPAVRTIDASFLNSSPLAMAVTDDGQWTAAIFPSGVYAFGATSQIVPLQTDPGVVALAFFHNNHTLGLAAATRATSIADVGGANQPSILYDYSQQFLSPRAIALSFDNQHAVVADGSGKLVNIAVSGSTANIVDCGCFPTGLYGLGDAVFRLNGSERTGQTRTGHTPDLKLFDASTGSVWIVPPALSLTGGRQ